MVDIKVINKIIVFTSIALLFVASFFVLKPIIIAIFLGILLAYILHPLYNPIKRKIKNANLATSIFILVLTIIIAVPLWFFLPIFIKEIFDTYQYIQQIDLLGTISKVCSLFFSEQTARIIAVEVNVIVSKFFALSLDAASSSFANIGDLLLQLSVILFTFFFVTRDSNKIRDYLSKLSPLSTSTEEKFSMEFRNITNSIVFGQLITGLVQGVALGIALWLLGVPRVLFLTVIAIIASIIPIIGAWLVWIPVSLFLIASGQVTSGVILFFYGLLFVSTIDNVLRPFLISRNSNLNIFIAILGTIGGLYTFGVIGLILSPLILSYLLIVIEFYREGKLNELFKE